METKERLTDSDLEKIDNDITEALLSAANYYKGEDKLQPICIKRGGKEFFTFTIAPLDEDTIERCRRENTEKRGLRKGELDGNRFVAQLIYEATIEEDKKRLWRNKEVWQKLNIASGADCVQKVLSPAERSALENKLLDMIGYDEDLTEMLKN